MLGVVTVLVLSFLAATSIASADTTVALPSATVWNAQQVAQWAGDASREAALLDSERGALACEFDRNDSQACAQVGLAQAVLKDLASDRRDAAAADALEVFYQLVALKQQQTLLDESSTLLESLISMATRAEELELPDGDVNELRQQHFELKSQAAQARWAIKKLNHRLATLTKRQLVELESATLDPAIPSHWFSPTPSTSNETQALEIARTNRGDYQALETLCRCMNVDSLPAGKALMGLVNPGLGLLASGSAPTSVLKLLHTKSPGSSELACRRRQCSESRAALLETISEQVTLETMSVHEARERLTLATELTEIMEENSQRQKSAVAIDQAPPGSERVAQLAEIRRRSELLDRERELAVATVRLNRQLGILHTP